MKLIIIIIVASGLMNTAQAQQLASERPVASFYSKTTKDKLQFSNADRQPAALKARQVLPSQKAEQQPSVPARIKIEKKQLKRSSGGQQLASERPIDMDRINRQRRRN